jgi:putative peptidoglycan lipid II flippase
LSFSMIPYMARDTITRIFYAFDDSKTPLIVGVIAIVVNAVMDWALVGPLGVGGITLSTTIVTLVNMILLTFLIRMKVKDIGLRKIILPTLKIFASALLMGALSYFLSYLWTLIFPDTTLYVLVKLIVIGIIGFGFYCMLTVLFGLHEAKKIMSKFSRFIPQRKTNQ